MQPEQVPKAIVKPLMTDVLENERNFRQPDLSTKQVIVVVLQLYISEVVPPRSCGEQFTSA